MKTIDIKKMKKEFGKIDKNAMYSPEQILEMGVISDTALKPSVFTLYRLIKNGKLKALNHGSGGAPRYFIKGAVLKDFVKERYSL